MSEGTGSGGTNWTLIGTAAGGVVLTALSSGTIAINGNSRLDEANEVRMVGMTYFADQLERTQINTRLIYDQKQELAEELRILHEKYEALLLRLANLQ